MSTVTNLVIGKRYSREEIRDLLGGGDNQSFLPQKNGRAIAGCFDPKLNYSAPIEIDVGDGITVKRTAWALIESGHTVPVFLKRAAKQWEYIGRYKATSISTSPSDLQQPGRRPDAVAVFFMEETFDEHDATAMEIESPSGFIEGGLTLQMHFRRERSCGLIQAKKKCFKHKHGHLFCEACGFKPVKHLGLLGDACFEAHYRLPLASLVSSISMRLEDLSILCANCHRFIHRFDELPTVERFKGLLNQTDSI